LRTVLGLHSISNLVKNWSVKFLDGLFDTGSGTLMTYTLCSKKSDAKIQITITMAHLIRI